MGPIPVRTGEPAPDSAQQETTGAYPRSHGGTRSTKAGSKWLKGLSPFARGNLLVVACLWCGPGPIPVRTGEPEIESASNCFSRAYPRSHGGTQIKHGAMQTQCGLSPFARGNRELKSIDETKAGPIPVRTGEPQKD